jgi:sialidase-1
VLAIQGSFTQSVWRVVIRSQSLRPPPLVGLALLALLATVVLHAVAEPRSAEPRSAQSRSAEPRSTEPRSTEVFVAGAGGYHTYRIPSLLVTPKGTLLAFAEARRAGAADAGDIDLVLTRSRDNGATWSAMHVIADDGANTVGNPCPVVDRKTGVIWLLTTHNLGTDREKDIIAGTSQASRTVWVMTSPDDGVNWSTPVDITSQVKRPDWTWYATGPGVGIQTRSGRLVIPANHVDAATGLHRSHLFYSDDDGASWTIGASAEAGTNESQVVELSDGRLLLNMRNHPPKPENYRLVAISPDGGRSLAPATMDRTLIEPPAQASLTRFARADRADTSSRRHNSGASGRDGLLFVNPASTRRERLTLRVSYDDGTTWPVARVLHDGPAAYSSVAVLPDLSIGVLYERGEHSPYERITFSRLTLDWLTAGQDPHASESTSR